MLMPFSESEWRISMTTPFPFITVIGTGNMGSSLIHGLIQSGHPANKICGVDQHLEKLNQLKQSLPIHITTNEVEAASKADVIIFATKPDDMAAAVTAVAASVATRRTLVISIAAGVREARLQQWLRTENKAAPAVAIVRAMPNTPALVNAGATGLYANAQVTPTQHELAESILRAVGIVVWLPQESLLDVVTALSGSGPAYFFLVMEAMQQAAIELGLPTDTARLLTQQTALGAARMAIENDISITELRRQVTSPGGTTEKAIAVLEENQLREVFRKALQAAKLRAEELGGNK